MNNKSTLFIRFAKQGLTPIERTIMIVIVVAFILSFFSYLSSVGVAQYYSYLLCISLALILAITSLPAIFYTYRPLSFKNILKTSILTLGMILFIILGTFLIIPSYKDLSEAINSDYSSIIGTCKNLHITNGRGKSLKFIINGIEFHTNLGYKSKMKNGDIYKVVYLPNSKFVISIYGYK